VSVPVLDMTEIAFLPTSHLIALATNDEMFMETLREWTKRLAPEYRWSQENRGDGIALVRQFMDAVNAEIDIRIPPRKP